MSFGVPWLIHVSEPIEESVELKYEGRRNGSGVCMYSLLCITVDGIIFLWSSHCHLWLHKLYALYEKEKMDNVCVWKLRTSTYKYCMCAVLPSKSNHINYL